MASTPAVTPATEGDASKEKNADCYETITEGSATMVYPADQEQTVFYNPVQVQNRDLSTLMIALFAERRRTRMAVKAKKKELREALVKGDDLKQQLEQYEKNDLNAQELIAAQDPKEEGIHILDALAASGLRSMRYWKEIPGVQHVTINDLDPAAVERAHANLERNGLKEVEAKERSYGIRIQHGDATHEMYTSRKATHDQLHGMNDQYDVIDLDPYGSAAPFLDGAVQAIRDGGMLNVTCTDMAALGGSHPETCYGRYNGSMPIQRAAYLQEVALRILLYSLAVTAAKYGRTIKPILSVGMNFYVRCFVEVHDDKAAINKLSLNLGSVYQSTQCSSFVMVPHGQHSKNNKNVYQPARAPTACTETGAAFKVGGPMWLGALHDQDVVLEALKRLNSKSDGTAPNMSLIATRARIQGLLTSVSEELHDVPLYYTLPDLCHVVSCECPPQLQFKAALMNAGYRVSGYHKDPEAIKTDAPPQVVWDIMRVWCQSHPPKVSKKKEKKRLFLEQKKQKKNEEKRKLSGENTTADAETSTPPPPKEERLSTSQKILAIKPSIEVDFTIPKDGLGRNSKVARFPMNPQKNWGPKPRASGKRKRPDEESKETEEGGDGKATDQMEVEKSNLDVRLDRLDLCVDGRDRDFRSPTQPPTIVAPAPTPTSEVIVVNSISGRALYVDNCDAGISLKLGDIDRSAKLLLRKGPGGSLCRRSTLHGYSERFGVYERICYFFFQPLF